MEELMPKTFINPFYATRVSRQERQLSQPREPAGPVYAKLPDVPRSASPVPHLTSLYHNPDAGAYGDRSYPGNCSGQLIKDLLIFFRARAVLDCMSGSGTCRDVCNELAIPCHSYDLRT